MKHKEWTAEELSILHKHYPYTGAKEVVALTGRPEGSVYSKAAELKLKANKSGVFKDEDLEKVLLIHKGKVVRSVSIKQKYDFISAISDWYRDMRPAIKRGDKIQIEIVTV